MKKKQKKNNTDYGEKIKDWFLALPWQRKMAFSVVFLVLALQFQTLATYQHLPAPIYGGDLYREKGFTLHILNGNPFWDDPYLVGEYEFYPPFGYLMTAGISVATDTDVEFTMIYMALLMTILLCYGAYVLSKEIFEDETYAFLGMLVNLISTSFIELKHSHVIGIVFMFLFLRYFIQLHKTDALRPKVLAGLFLGLVSLSHYKPFLVTVLIIIITVLFEAIYQLRKGEKVKKLAVIYLQRYWVTAAIGIALSMIFFGPIIWKYHLKTLNLTNQYSLFDTDKNGLIWYLGFILKSFIRFDSIITFFYSAMTALGTIYCVLNFRKLTSRFTLYWLVAIFLGTGHYLITKPLFNNWVVPSHISAGIVVPRLLLMVFGVHLIAASLKKEHLKYIVVGIFCLLVVGVYADRYQGYHSDRWVDYGRSLDAQTQVLFDIGDWLREHVSDSESILAHDESSFMLNGVSGKKVVTVRRTHASPYVDMDQRYADTVVMFYGNNGNVTKQLFEKYNVAYVYYDRFLVQNPMTLELRFEDYLKENGVQYSIENVRFDPSSLEAPSQDALVVPPQTITLEEFVIPHQAFQVGEGVHSVFFRLNESALASS